MCVCMHVLRQYVDFIYFDLCRFDKNIYLQIELTGFQGCVSNVNVKVTRNIDMALHPLFSQLN